EAVKLIPPGSDQIRAVRKLQMYWAILKKAGYPVDESRLLKIAPTGRIASQFDPGFAGLLRDAAYAAREVKRTPSSPASLDELRRELEVVMQYRRANPTDKHLTTASGNPLFDADDLGLLEFLEPAPGRSGVSLIQPYRKYHDPNAGDFQEEILKLLDLGDTVILDLGNANPEVMAYFSNSLSQA